MDSKSLFLTANADTVYYFTFLDLTKGRGWEVSAAASGLSRRFTRQWLHCRTLPHDAGPAPR